MTLPQNLDYEHLRALGLDRYDPRNSKLPRPTAGIFDYPSVTVCINRDWIPFITGVLERLVWEDVWDGDANDVETAMQEITKLMMLFEAGCCGGLPTGAMTRITDDGVLEMSTDGGVTWTPVPEFDPRTTSTEFPPLPSDIENKACAGAENARQQLEDFIDQLADILEAGGALTTLVGAATAIAAVFLSGGALAPLIVGICAAFISAGAASIRAAFDPTQLDAFLCCVKANLDDTARVTDQAALLECISTDMSGLASTITYAIVTMLGAVGVTNWARTGSADGMGCGACGECDDCVEGTSDTWSYQSLLPEGWTYAAGGGGNWDSNPMYLSATPDLDCITFDQDLCVLQVTVSVNTLGSGGVIIHAGDQESPEFPAGTSTWTLTTTEKTNTLCFENTTAVAGGVSLNSFTLHWCVPA